MDVVAFPLVSVFVWGAMSCWQVAPLGTEVMDQLTEAPTAGLPNWSCTFAVHGPTTVLTAPLRANAGRVMVAGAPLVSVRRPRGSTPVAMPLMAPVPLYVMA